MKEPDFARIYHWEKAMPQYTLGHEGRLGRIEQGLSKLPGSSLSEAPTAGSASAIASTRGN